MTQSIDYCPHFSYHAVKEHMLLNGSNEQRGIVLAHLDNLLAAKQSLDREVKRLREGIERLRQRHGQEEGWKELKEMLE
tara:strand:- start:394 stop:630 length:237 start_codon:yes stop_codon:yes gene_type:complete